MFRETRRTGLFRAGRYGCGYRLLIRILPREVGDQFTGLCYLGAVWETENIGALVRAVALPA